MSKPTRTRNSDYVDISSKSQVENIYNKRKKAKETPIKVATLILAVIFLITGCGMIYFYNALDSLNFKNTEYQLESNPDIDKMDLNVDDMLDDSQLLSDSKTLNIMLFGEDYHSNNSYGRSDSMILATINNRSKTIKLTSFQRDTYVFIPGHGYSKITHAFSYGGPTLAIKTVEANFGIRVDRYAVVDFKSFQKIVDILGGVKIDITAEEAGYINLQVRINNQQNRTTVLDRVDGEVTLDGLQSLWYARNRGFQEQGVNEVYSGDDWDRTERQRKFLNAIFTELKSATLPQIINIVAEVGPLITTNLKKNEITGLVSKALTYLDYEFQSYSMPQEGFWEYGMNEAGSVILITNLESCRTELAKFVFDGVDETSETDNTTE